MEANETVIVTLTSTSNTDVTIGATDDATVMIANDDQVAVSISSLIVAEDDGVVTITFTADNAVQDGFSVDVISTDGTATTADNDYTALVSETVTFIGTAGETQTVDITIGVDTKVESDEQFFLGLVNAVGTTASSTNIIT